MSTSRTRHDYFYFQIVLDNYRLYRTFAEDLGEMLDEGEVQAMVQDLEDIQAAELDEEEESERVAEVQSNTFFQKVALLRNAGASAVVFTAMCLEALINDYGALNTSNSYFSNHLDSLSILSKWILIPKVVAGQSFPTDGQAFELLSDLFNYRNKLVHPKGKEIVSIRGEEPSMVSETAELAARVPKCVITVREVTKKLWEIDDEFEYLNQYRPLWDKEYKEEDDENTTDMERMIRTMVNQLPRQAT